VAQNGAQPVYQALKVETWVGLEDGLIRSERMTARLLPPISDPKKMPDPITFDAVLTYSEVNQPITIIPPQLPEPTATAVPVAAPQPSAGGPTGLTTGPAGAATPVQPAPPNGAAAPQAPTPGIAETPPSGPFGTPEEVPTETTAGPPPSQQEQSLAAERALVAIATGGQPRTGSFALGSNILLDVPFRTQQSGSAYAPTNSGAATEAMVFAGYGTEVAVNDLRALLNGLDGNYSPGVGSRIETMARVAERGGLNVLDLYRGPRFNEWTVEQVREMIRRGYPLITLVQGAVLPGGTPPGVARERYITIIGIDGDDIIYHDPAYPDEGTGAARRVSARLLEQGWLAASTPRLAAAFSQGPEGRGLLDNARAQTPPGSPAAASPTPALNATVPVVGTVIPTPTATEPEYPFGLPVHPVLVLFWLVLVVLLVIILIRSLR
jgi:hypothetical protein